MQRPSLSAFGHLRVYYCDDVVAVAESGNLCIVIWRGAVTKHPFGWQKHGLEDVVKRHPRGAGFLCIIEPAAKAPGEELRKASSQLVLGQGPALKCVACVVEGQGFKAAINRGALAGITLLLRRHQFATLVAAEPPEAIRWMSKHVAIPSVDEMTATVEELRSKIPLPEERV